MAIRGPSPTKTRHGPEQVLSRASGDALSLRLGGPTSAGRSPDPSRPPPRRRRIGPRRRRSPPPSRIAVPSLGGELSLRLHPGDLAGGLGGGGVARSPARVDRVPVLSGGHGYVGHGGWIMSGVVSCSGGEWERVGYAGSPEWDSAARLQSWGWGCSRGQYCRLLSASQAGIFVTGPHSVFLICIVIIMYIVQNVQ